MSDHYETLVERVKSRDAVVALVGLGYVGLPLALTFAEAGFRVVGVDTNASRVASLNSGVSYVSDVPSHRLTPFLNGAAGQDRPSGSAGVDGGGLKRSGGRLQASTDFGCLSEADAIIISVPTPLSKTKQPDLSNVVGATDEVAARLRPGMLVVLESTTYPGTTEEVLLPRFENRGGDGQSFEVGKDFFLAFSPERIDPGRSDWTVDNTPKVIGGVTPQCASAASALYGSAIQTVVPVSSPGVAEMVKLLENTFRAVNIALVNEVAIMCDRLGLDVWEVIEAAKSKPFGFMPFYPGPGLGGHCIPIDPQYLAWKLESLNYRARFIGLAAEINFGMPGYVVDKIANALNEERKPLKGSKVLILGVSYKADVGDVRESPALDIARLLLEKGSDVSYHDPYVPNVEVNGWALSSVTLDAHTLGDADCVVIAAAHSGYDWQWVTDNSKLIVDTRNATSGVTPPRSNVVKL
jgi:UDP-N-acetyl-D-glucosamine dehydrogenase